MFFLGIFILFLQTFFAQTNGGNVGIGFSTNGPFDVPLGQMKSKNVFILKNWDIVPELLDQMEITYAQDSLDVTVAVPNYKLSAVANNDQTYLNFVRDQLVKHRRIVKLVAVGNEPFLQENRAQAMPYIQAAFNRIVKLVGDNGLANQIKVTIPFSGVVLANTYPVESTVFDPQVISLMRSVTATMISTGSKFSINLYPYFDYYYNSADISLAFALGKSGSLFEAKLRGCRIALDKIGANSLPIIIGETGWPSAGGKDTNIANMKAYTEYIVNFARTSQLASAIYIFEAYDESWKQGSPVEQHWGLYYEGSRTPKFEFDISSYTQNQGGSVNWSGNDWALNCDFPGQDLSNVQTASSQCGSTCVATAGCTHYTWTSYNGGTCWMKNGAATKADAVYVSKPDFVCGVRGVNWMGNKWAFSCDFKDTSFANAKVQGSYCSSQCAATSGCTHFTWTNYNGGTCWMKKGAVALADAFFVDDSSFVCGIL